MYCPRCGKETEQSGNFCQSCGISFKDLTRRPFTKKRTGTIKTESFSGLSGRFLGGLIDLFFLILFDLMVAAAMGIISWLLSRPDPV
ncbi:MAG TPA: zinc ribbon domain-containing protein, partial [Methanoregulaceae archaeon]|nr:zinc ribbon domain-containing protein [Methanoregulaceae archaeon]